MTISNSERITVEEWAGEHSFNVSNEQIEELLNALDMVNEMDTEQFRQPLGFKSSSDLLIDELSKKIRMLESFIQSKGHSISVGDSKITEYRQEAVGNSHIGTYETDHYF